MIFFFYYYLLIIITAQNHILRKSTDSDEEKLLIGIFLCFSNACQFQIFKAGFEDGMFVFLRVCTLYAPEVRRIIILFNFICILVIIIYF